jgi:hypothetical protein
VTVSVAVPEADTAEFLQVSV